MARWRLQPKGEGWAEATPLPQSFGHLIPVKGISYYTIPTGRDEIPPIINNRYLIASNFQIV